VSWDGSPVGWPLHGSRCRSTAAAARPNTESLAIDGSATYRLAYVKSGCPGPCNPLLQVTRTGGDHWNTLRRIGSGFGAGVTAAGPLVVVTASGHPDGGAPEAHTEYLISNDGGQHWRERDDPCGGQLRHEWDTSEIAITPEKIAAICTERSSFHRHALVTSTDQGKVFTARRPLTHRGLERLRSPIRAGQVFALGHPVT
jgi:hypothetical protein